MPKPEHLMGNYVDRIDVADGAMQVRAGRKINKHFTGQVLSLRPIVVKGSPLSPVSWICGHASVPEGMQAVGDDRTTVDDRFLPTVCRTGRIAAPWRGNVRSTQHRRTPGFHCAISRLQFGLAGPGDETPDDRGSG